MLLKAITLSIFFVAGEKCRRKKKTVKRVKIQILMSQQHGKKVIARNSDKMLGVGMGF